MIGYLNILLKITIKSVKRSVFQGISSKEPKLLEFFLSSK